MSLSYALSEWAATLGVGALELPPQGHVSLQLSTGDRLTLEEAGDELLVYQVIDFPHLDGARCMALLQACNLRRRPAHEPAVQAGLRGDGADAQVVLLLRLQAHGLQASMLQAATDLLARCRRDWLALMN